MTKEPSMTPQELREIAGTANTYWELPNDEQVKLRVLADWLELHMPLYREALELLQANLIADEFSFEEQADVRKKARALLAKVKEA